METITSSLWVTVRRFMAIHVSNRRTSEMCRARS